MGNMERFAPVSGLASGFRQMHRGGFGNWELGVWVFGILESRTHWALILKGL